jgi:hypothetical protein
MIGHILRNKHELAYKIIKGKIESKRDQGFLRT